MTRTQDETTVLAPRQTATFMSPEALLEHWQGHRRLTRRVIDTFPPDALFTFTIGGMRPCASMAHELLAMAAPTVLGVLEDVWDAGRYRGPFETKEALLDAWDAATAEMDALWSRIPPERFLERRTAFGQYEGVVHDLVLYVVDNEIHHRGQAYVFLRALGIEPPPFWERD